METWNGSEKPSVLTAEWLASNVVSPVKGSVVRFESQWETDNNKFVSN